MKHQTDPFVLKYSKQILLGTFFSILFIFAAEAIPKVFERFLPFEHYVEIQAITVNDVTVGDKYQSGVIVRDVKDSAGYPIDVVTELMLVGMTDDGDTKIFYTTQHQFLEKSEDTHLNFREPIPTDIEPGKYYWIYGFTLNVNNHVYKSKAVRSNDFTVRRISELIDDNEIIESIEVNEEKARAVDVDTDNPNVTSTTTDSDI